MQSLNLKKSSIVFLLLLAACSTPTNPPFKGQKIGKPYEINGKIYRPEPDSTYDKIGDASWYGPGFDGKRTASGEVFDQDDITAAHPTLPLPSLVKVTNLQNNRSVVARINDRGPYHSNRIIDLSKGSAEMIGLKSTQPVRVQFLDAETQDYLASIQNVSPKIDMVAYNENYTEKTKEREVALAEKMDEVASAPNFNRSEVEDFAPIQSVASRDIGSSAPASPPPAKPATKPSHFLISDAVAEDNVVEAPQPVDETPIPAAYKPSVPAKQASAPEPANDKQVHLQPLEEKPTRVQPKPAETKASKPAAEKGKYTIMAGSFSSRENAEKLANSAIVLLGNRNLTSIDKVNAIGKDWWRLRIGPFDDKETAAEALKNVRSMGAPDARLSKQ